MGFLIGTPVYRARAPRILGMVVLEVPPLPRHTTIHRTPSTYWYCLRTYTEPHGADPHGRSVEFFWIALTASFIRRSSTPLLRSTSAVLVLVAILVWNLVLSLFSNQPFSALHRFHLKFVEINQEHCFVGKPLISFCCNINQLHYLLIIFFSFVFLYSLKIA